jgi:putative nucleotidyltransferase with HDIG domain
MTHTTLGHLATQERTRREILHKSDLIPPLPELVIRLLRALSRQDTEPADLESLLRNDQVLVARMLTMVNSPFYGLNRTIRTIKDAVMVLGFRGLRSLVLATSTAKFLQRDYSCFGHEPRGLWLHAVCVASGSKTLARARRMSLDDAEQVFVTGLLHDIGKLVLAPYLAEAGVRRERGVALPDFERSTLGIDHAEAGALVAAKWGLAKEIHEVLAAHHEAGEAAGSPSQSIVRLADAVAHEMEIGYAKDCAPVGLVSEADLAVLSMTREAWHEAKKELMARMDEAACGLIGLET